MSTINFNFFRFSWKFIFIGQFFILICNFRIIFIVVYCVVFYNKTLRCMALRRSHFQCGKCEGRRSQSSVARTPSLALPPRWARKEFCVVVCTALLTFVCMLRYWMWNVVPIWFLDSSIFMAIRYADLQSDSGILRYLWWYAVPIWLLDSSIFMMECCADLRSSSCILRYLW